MKKIFISIALLASISIASLAQTNESGKSKRNIRLVEKLNLSTDQRKIVDKLDVEYKEKFNELKNNKSLTKQEKRTQNKELYSQKRSSIKEILTVEQQAKFDTQNLKSEKKFSKNHKGRKGKIKQQYGQNKRMINPYSDLNLTAEQEQKIKDLNKNFRTKSKDLALERRTAITGILTPDQQAKIQDSKSNIDKRKSNYSKGQRNGKKFSHNDQQRNFKLAPEYVDRLSTLEDSYFQQKQSIKKSRIAPEEQERRISELRKKYKNDRREIIKDARKPENKV